MAEQRGAMEGEPMTTGWGDLDPMDGHQMSAEECRQLEMSPRAQWAAAMLALIVVASILLWAGL